ncbi:MAG: hypothetical protein RLZZ08_645 [Pseudomonadota bacterium]|jgi:thiosulfate reductase cytochrome b subunit
MKRHALITRLWHWINALSVIVLFLSGLNISNAHRHLYWGEAGYEPRDAWFHVMRFPGWMTIPDYYSLAGARDWHVVFTWIFAVSLLLFMIGSLASGHFRRDLATRWREWHPASIGADIANHLKFQFHSAGSKYNFLQKASYGLVIFVALPLMIVTGMGMSPGMDAAAPWLGELFGGRQSARSVHFLCAFALSVFFFVHVLLVLLSGPVGQMRDMITGGRDEAA